jgi:hypothetical protein
MSVATLLMVINILGGMGTLAKDVIDVRSELEKLPAGAQAPAEHVATVKAAMGQGGSLWGDSTAQGFTERLGS